ncbi:MAG: hypothetical protein K8Q89_00240 [Nitrosarchaeum sp.]|nr:hypothetical protein [Nitrosarchaeum sp.]
MRFSEMVRFGIKFQKSTNRGTRIIRSKLTFINWNSEEFREFQTRQLSSIPSNFIIHIGRGIRTMKIGDLPKLQKSANTIRHSIVINRGTKTRTI